MKRIAKHIVFSGRVQGVGFRFSTFDTANRYELTGWVRNMPNSSVEMILQGPAKDVSDCIKDIQESLGDHIRETTAVEIPVNPEFLDFKITF